jgi:hypothetical protein
MVNLSVLEQHSEFISASRRARDLALRFHETMGVRRSTTGWVVLASPLAVSALTSPNDDSVHDVDAYSDPYDDDSHREVVQPLIEEIQSDQDAWARTEEEGWFYDD